MDWSRILTGVGGVALMWNFWEAAANEHTLSIILTFLGFLMIVHCFMGDEDDN